MAQIPILEDPDCDCADKTANSLDEASIITLAGSVLEAGDHRDKLPGQLQALRHVVEILFLKPEQEGKIQLIQYTQFNHSIPKLVKLSDE